jgi:AraC-like DNA-binding protein
VYTPDVDEARSYFRDHSYTTTQLLPQAQVDRFAFDAALAHVGPFTVGEVSYGADVRIICPDLSSGYHVLMKVSGVTHSLHRGRKVAVGPQLAAVYGPVGDTRMDWPAGSRMLSVRVDSAAFEQEIALATGLPMATEPTVGASFDVIGGRGRSWATLVREFYTELCNPESIIHQPQMAQRWWRLILSGLALSVELPDGHDRRTDDLGLRPRPVKRVLEVMHADPGRPFTLTDLAQIAGVGVRTLQESFRRTVGMPPMMYLRELRLARVHEELVRSDRWQVSISEVAFRWGFTHLGRFAGAYRQQYGVSPSRTLRDRA